MFSKIAGLRDRDKRLCYYFPKSYEEGILVDPNRWLVRALTFEGLFRDCYPDFKQNKRRQFRAAKKAALDALNAVDQRNMVKHERDYFNDCRRQIEHYEGLLQEILDFIVKEKYGDALDDLLRFNYKECHMDSNAYGKVYSDYRNKIAHGDIAPIGKKEIAVYRVLQATIYFLLLEGAGLENDTLRTMAKKLFL